MVDAGPKGEHERWAATDPARPATDANGARGVDGLLPAQRQAVDAPGAVAVVAGAGTGKTHMLAHRYLKHVRDGLDPLEIVAVTFTERAAAELRARIRDLLARSLPEGSPAVLTVEAAQISTMHALAQRICQEFPEPAGVPADFTILDDLEGSVWMAERIEGALSELPPSLFDAAPYGAVRDTVAALLADPITADAAFGHDSAEWPALVAAVRADALAAVLDAPAWRDAVATVRAVMGPEDDRREATRRDALRALDTLVGTQVSEDGHGEGPRAALAALSALNLRGGSTSKYAAGDFALLGDALKYVRGAARAALEDGLVDLELGEADARLAQLLPDLEAAYQRVRDRLQAQKHERRVLDFADLEVHALRALEDPQVVAHYRTRWQALLVDEFQDTNAVQERILDRLSGSMTVTVVGDEKQSIYGFRGAKTEVFQRYRRQVVALGGAEVKMSASFRSHAGLLAAINRTFAPLLDQAHQELTPTRAAGPSGGPYVTLTVVEKGDVKANRLVSEAKALAAELKRMVEAGMPINDRRTGGSRPVRFGDIAVLARNWQALGVYGEVLPAMGVPAVHTGGGNLLAMREVKDGIALLRFLAGPDDDVALAAVLRSPYFAVDDVTLFRLAAHRAELQGGRRDHRVSLWQALSSLPDTGSPEARARQVLTALQERSALRAPSDVLRAADSLTGYSGVLAGLPGGRRRLADYGGLLDLVRRLESGSKDLFTTWRRLRGLVRASLAIRRPRLAAEGAVTLLTIHSSKGLEWPVVAVADLERRNRTQREPVLIDADVGVAFRLEDDDGGVVEPALYKILRARKALREEQEERRLLYVALTRARDRLILSSAAESGGALDVLEPGLEAAGVPRTVIPHEVGRSNLPTPPTPVVAATDADRDEALGRAAGASTAADDPAQVAMPALALTARVGQGTTASGTTDDGPWLEMLDLVGQLDDGWSPLAWALAAAGVRAPASDLAGRWLRAAATTGAGGVDRGPATYSLLTWRTDGGIVALVDDAARPGTVTDAGMVTVSRRPHGPVVAADETLRLWSLHVDPHADVETSVGHVLGGLASVDDRATG